MNISCAVIKDLLPLYHDGVCSDESKSLVDSHLDHCESCIAELELMDTELKISNQEQNLVEASAVNNLSRKWKKGMMWSLLKGVLITLLTIIAFMIIAYLFIDIRIT